MQRTFEYDPIMLKNVTNQNIVSTHLTANINGNLQEKGAKFHATLWFQYTSSGNINLQEKVANSMPQCGFSTHLLANINGHLQEKWQISCHKVVSVHIFRQISMVIFRKKWQISCHKVVSVHIFRQISMVICRKSGKFHATVWFQYTSYSKYQWSFAGKVANFMPPCGSSIHLTANINGHLQEKWQISCHKVVSVHIFRQISMVICRKSGKFHATVWFPY